MNITNIDEERVRNAINATEHDYQDAAWKAFNRILVDLDTTRQNNWALCTAIREYHEAITAVHTFVNAYLQGGGDPTNIPERWNDLDKQRQIKYATLLQLAGVSS
jgi:hypothetical protein